MTSSDAYLRATFMFSNYSTQRQKTQILDIWIIEKFV